MKQISYILVALFAFLVYHPAHAQQNQINRQQYLENMQAEEIKINQFVLQKMNEQFSQKAMDKFLNNMEHKSEIPVAEMDKIIENYKQAYYRNLYFELNPMSRRAYNPGQMSLSGTGKKTRAAVCTDGDFEDGVADLATYLGFGDNSYMNQNGECNFVPVTNVVMPNVGFGNANDFLLTNNNADPIISTINQTHNGSDHALRINAPTPCWAGGGVNMLQKTFTVNSNGLQTVSFSYALIMEDPNHTNQNPFFVARVLDANGVEQDRICRISDATNPFFQTIPSGTQANGCTYGTIVYRNWICESLTFNGTLNQTYTLEFFVADCAQGGHFAYAYLDDICVDCVPDTCNNPGNIVLMPTDTCDKTMTVCASYTPPMLNCVAGTIDPNSVTLTVLQNGSPTGIVLTGGTVNTTNQTICFTVTPATFGTLTGGFDFMISAGFTLGGGTVTLDDTHTNPGQNNDYTTNPCDMCDCGSWSNMSLYQTQPSVVNMGSYPCNVGIAQNLDAGKTYRFRFKYNCNSTTTTCVPTYTYSEDINGTVTTQTTTSGYFYVYVTPNQKDCGVHNIMVTPYCDGQPCPPCGFAFNVTGCHDCVEPFNDTIYCDKQTGNPVLEFCLKNITSQPRSFFGVTVPAGVSVTNLTPVSTATHYFNTVLGMHIFETPSPVPVNGSVCTIKFRVDGGIYKGQTLCLDVKSFTYVNPQGQFLNCCADTIPLCFTIPDCRDDCADLVNASIYCDLQGNRILRYKIKNNYFAQLDAYESFTVNGTPADYFFGFFSTPVLLGNTSPYIYHTIPNSIPSGSTYCFTNTVHMYYSNGHPCDSICYTDTVCLKVPYCGIISPPDTVKEGNETKSVQPLPYNQEENTDYLIYPNPVDQVLYIKSQEGEMLIRRIELKDVAGKVLFDGEVDSRILYRLDMTNIPGGVYFIRINDSKVYKVLKR